LFEFKFQFLVHSFKGHIGLLWCDDSC